MPKEDNNETTQLKAKSSISMEELQAVVNAAVTAALQMSNASSENIAAALIEARKPYVDPRNKVNQEAAQRNSRELMAREKANLALSQSQCPHKKGSNALSWYSDDNNSSFALHKLDTGEWIGVCTNCTKIISSQIPADAEYFQKSRGTNIRSAAGERFFTDPRAAQAARLNAGQKEIFVDEATGEAISK